MAQSDPILSPRLCITPFSERHLTGRYVGWLNDLELMRFSEQRHKRHTIDTCREYMKTFAGSPHYFWALEERVQGLGHIGNINAYIDRYNQVADVGILVGEAAARGKGLAAEAFGTVIDYLLGKGAMRKVTAGTMAVNEPMLHLMRRAGMVEDGVRQRHYLYEGREVDIVHMAKFAGSL